MPFAAPGPAGTDQALHIAMTAIVGRLQSGRNVWPPPPAQQQQQQRHDQPQLADDGDTRRSIDSAAANTDTAALPLAEEDAYARLYDIAADLSRRVRLHVRPHESGWVCTQSLYTLEHCWHFEQRQSGATEASTQMFASALDVAPAVGAPPCDLIHQWDREALHYLTTPLLAMGEGGQHASSAYDVDTTAWNWHKVSSRTQGSSGGAATDAAPMLLEDLLAVSPVACNRNFFSNRYEDCYQLQDWNVSRVGLPTHSQSIGGMVDSMQPSSREIASRVVWRRETRIVWVDPRTEHPPEECASGAEITATRYQSGRRQGQ